MASLRLTKDEAESQEISAKTERHFVLTGVRELVAPEPKAPIVAQAGMFIHQLLGH